MFLYPVRAHVTPTNPFCFHFFSLSHFFFFTLGLFLFSDILAAVTAKRNSLASLGSHSLTQRISHFAACWNYSTERGSECRSGDCR